MDRVVCMGGLSARVARCDRAEPACGAPVTAARNARHRSTGSDPTDPSRPTRGSSGDSPRSVSTTRPSRRPVPGSASATSSSPIHASAPRSLAVGLANSGERKAPPANHKGVQFSVATNGKFTVATNTSRKRRLRPCSVSPPSRIGPGMQGGGRRRLRSWLELGHSPCIAMITRSFRYSCSRCSSGCTSRRCDQRPATDACR